MGLQGDGAAKEAESTSGSSAEEDEAQKNEDQNGDHQVGVFTKGLKHGDGVSLLCPFPGRRRSKAGRRQGSRGIAHEGEPASLRKSIGDPSSAIVGSDPRT